MYSKHSPTNKSHRKMKSPRGLNRYGVRVSSPNAAASLASRLSLSRTCFAHDGLSTASPVINEKGLSCDALSIAVLVVAPETY